MNKVNNSTRRVEDIINSINESEGINERNYCCQEQRASECDESENYEDYYIEEDILDDCDENILGVNSDEKSEEAPYYTEGANYNLERDNECSNLNYSDNLSNYYTDSLNNCGEEIDYESDECFSEGIEEGYSEGYEEGVAEGRNLQCRRAYEEGFCNGRRSGFQEGYEKAKQEVIDYINERNRNRNNCRKKCHCRCRCM